MHAHDLVPYILVAFVAIILGLSIHRDHRGMCAECHRNEMRNVRLRTSLIGILLMYVIVLDSAGITRTQAVSMSAAFALLKQVPFAFAMVVLCISIGHWMALFSHRKTSVDT